MPETVDDIVNVIFIAQAYKAYEPSTGRMFITYGKTRKICGETLCKKKIEEVKKIYPKYFLAS